MDAEGLAMEAIRLRKLKGLSQQEVADMLVHGGYRGTISKQLISRAEDPKVTSGGRLQELRVAIIEALGEKRLRGPVWFIEEDK